MPRKPVNACHQCHVRRTEIQKAHVWSKVQVKTSIQICHNIMEWTYGVAIESVAALLCQKSRRRITGRVIVRVMVNTEKPLRKRWPMMTSCSKHKDYPSKGQIGRGKHPKRRKTITHGTNSGILKALFCAPGGMYRPEFLKLNLTSLDND